MAIKLLFLFIFALNGFGIFGLSNTLTLGAILLIANNSFFKRNPYRNLLLFILVGIVLSFIPAYVYRGQSFFQTFKASVGYFYLIVFFAILKLKPNVKDAEKAMMYLSLVTSLIYILQYILLPRGISIIPVLERYITLSEGSGVGRFRMIGSAIFSLGYFYGLCNFISTNKFKYIVIGGINLIPIILLAFRTNLAGIALFSLVLLFKMTEGKIQKIFKYVLLACVVGVILLQIPAVSDRVDYIIEKQNEGSQSFANDDYIRWVTLNYYINEYPQGILDRILGFGSFYTDSSLGDHQIELHDQGIHWVDWGLVGLTWIIGPFTVLAMIWLNIVCCKLVTNKKYLYISIWFMYLIVISLVTSQDYFLHGSFVIQSIALYIGYRAYLENNQILYQNHNRVKSECYVYKKNIYNR